MKKYLKMAAILGFGLTASIAAFAHPWGGGSGGMGKMGAIMELPVEKQTLILSAIKEVKDENTGLREEIQTTRQNMKAILTAPEFDAAAFKANADKLEVLMTQGFRSFTDAVIEIAPQMTQEEREILARLAPGDGARGHGRHGGNTKRN